MQIGHEGTNEKYANLGQRVGISGHVILAYFCCYLRK